ncbi:MAG TPA: Type 1 glutamine amidotransferase-like domain-containing protein [Vicinamibacteria bacterium]|nr:Type 1 glutamine amidotransferase-like domain-containing protein [Vicinamibacteria bacterium]
MSARTVWLLGPQHHEPFLGRLFPTLGIESKGPVAVVTAGWQEREGEDEELDKHLGGRSVDLELYSRADRVFRSDPEFTQAHREMQRHLREIEGLYQMRLAYARDAVLRLLRESGDARLLRPERDHAMRQLRELDGWHLKRIIEVRSEFEERWKPLERESVARQREEVAKILRAAAALVVAGGHVAVLLNRLRLFGVRELAEGKHVIAWSAGAMVVTERVVLFHDHPPQGPGNAEVMEQGLGLCKRLVALPDGEKRLDLEDPYRVGSFAERFAPDACIVMGPGDAMAWNGEGWSSSGARRLCPDGSVEQVTSW